MPRRLALLLLLLAASLTALARPAAGQVSGRVADARGRPLPAVPVELWSRGRLVAVRATGPDGAFRFSEAEAPDGAVRLSASMIGYAPASREVSAPAADVVLALAAAPVTLEGLSATAPPALRCPNREDPEARRLWEAVRQRYDHTRDSMGLSLYARRIESTGPRQEIGLVEESRYVRAWYGVLGRARQPNVQDASAYPYGYPVRSSFDPAYAGWRYRNLAATDANHFLAASFGARHTLSVLARSGDAVVVGFCPRERTWKGVWIEGTLAVGRDTSLARAEWKFRTPRPSEDAGGEIVFVPRGAEPVPLLPAQSLFWRGIVGRRDSFFQRWEEFATYEFFPPNRLPPQPREWLSGR